MSSEKALNALDAAFLQVESERTPMHMGSVGIFEGDVLYDEEGHLRIDDIRRLIESRLPLVPKLRQVVSTGLLGEAPPVWIDDPNFDLVAHVLACQLPAPGTEVELRALCAEMMAAPLHRGRPMWDLTFVEGLAGHRVGLIERLHHSMADGLAAAELATVLLDLSPSLPQLDERDPWSPHVPLPVWRAAAADLLRLGGVWMRVASWGAPNADPSHHSVPSYGPVGSSDQHARHAEDRCPRLFAQSADYGVEGGGSRAVVAG